MFDRIHTYDMDGVLVDTSHRYRNKPDGTIDLEYWFANRTPEKIQQDRLLPLAKQYVSDCHNPLIYTVLCTARVRHDWDIAFIRDNLAMPNKLVMRPVGNEQGDFLLKHNQLRTLFNLRQFANLPRRLWEDNLKNIEALQGLFTSCYHVPSTITERA